MGGLLSLLGLVVLVLGIIGLFKRLPQFQLTSRGRGALFIIGGVLLMSVGAAASGSPSDQQAASNPTPTATASVTPRGTTTPTPTATPRPTGDPHLLTVANVKQSIVNNENLAVNTEWDNLIVEVRQGGQVVVVVKPPAIFDEQGLITQAAEDSLVVVQAVKGWYPGVTVIHMQLDTDFTDQYGQTKSEPAAWLEFTPSTFSKMNPKGLITRTFAQPSDLFALADSYYIHPAVWKTIKSDKRGQLFTYADGTAIVKPIPQ
jgi:hypothetical protein